MRWFDFVWSGAAYGFALHVVYTGGAWGLVACAVLLFIAWATGMSLSNTERLGYLNRLRDALVERNEAMASEIAWRKRCLALEAQLRELRDHQLMGRQQ